LALCALALCVVAAPACGPISGAPANPFVPETRFVTSVSQRGGYLDARLSGKPDLRFLFPSGPACAAVLEPEARVEYSARGRYGELNPAEPGGDPCIPMGVADLEFWRDKGPRPTVFGGTTSPLPRRPARFQEIWRDDAEIFLRGRFPLASWVGFGRADDLVAVVPNSRTCRSLIADGHGTLEYRFTGRPAFALMVKPPGSCPIRAFAIPLPGPPPARPPAGPAEGD
jgi:hypothetical protein